MRFRTPRAESKAHLDFIRGLPCLVCPDHNAISTEAAHIRMGARRLGKRATGMGEKPGDMWTVPLCGDHHRLQHELGEALFWSRATMNPAIVALALWAHTGNHEVGCDIVRAAHE